MTDDITHYVVYMPEGQPYFRIETQTCAADKDIKTPENCFRAFL